MIQLENDAVKEAMADRIEHVEEVQLQTNRRITKVEASVLKVATMTGDAYGMAKKAQAATQMRGSTRSGPPCSSVA